MKLDALRDPCSERGANKLAAAIVAYWRGQGYHGITARITLLRIPSKHFVHSAPVYGVVTNIGPRGFPPRHPL